MMVRIKSNTLKSYLHFVLSMIICCLSCYFNFKLKHTCKIIFEINYKLKRMHPNFIWMTIILYEYTA